MPIDYSKYPDNWFTEIRPRILKRANNRCEFPGCGLENGEHVWSVKYKGRTSGWFRDYDEAMKQPTTTEIKKGNPVPNPKKVKVVLTIAHLDHDEENKNVSDDRLVAACQLCHLRYDAVEKAKRKIINKQTK